jgi:DNA repair protein RecO (recombination protein O)
MMLHSTKGIVFHSIRYAESSIIVKIYTELFGLQSYLIKGIRNVRSKIKPALFQPLTLLDLVVYHREKQSLNAVREAHLAHPFLTIPFDVRKSSVTLFINELAYKAIREEEPNAGMFAFLWQTCLQLDEAEESVSCFHILFSLRLMHYLGIFPQNNHSARFPVFNMREGLFQAAIPNHPHYLDPANSLLMSHALDVCGPQQTEHEGKSEWRDFSESAIPDPASRNRLLETILLYYQLHLPGFKGVQSHHILHDVLA